MNNYLLNKKILLKILMFFVMFFWFIWVSNAATIYSSSEWGFWHLPWTWVWWNIPTEDDNVIINSDVYIGFNSKVNRLEVTSTWKISKTNDLMPNPDNLYWSSAWRPRIETNFFKNDGIIWVENDSLLSKISLLVSWDFENNWILYNGIYLTVDWNIESTWNINISDLTITKNWAIVKWNLNLFTLFIYWDIYLDGEIDVNYFYWWNNGSILKNNSWESLFNVVNIVDGLNTDLDSVYVSWFIKWDINANILYINWDATIWKSITLNTDILIPKGSSLSKTWRTSAIYVVLNWNLINNWTFWWTREDKKNVIWFYFLGDVINNWYISDINWFYLLWNFENNWEFWYFHASIYWEPFQWYTSYSIESNITINENKILEDPSLDKLWYLYTFSWTTLSNSSFYWKVKWAWDWEEYDWLWKRYINYEEITLPTAKNLKQYIDSPLLDEENLNVWTKIWKFQSWSWIILEAEIENNTEDKYNIVFDVYRLWLVNPQYSESVEVTTWTWRVIIPFLWEWDYSWNVRIETLDWNNSSEAIESFWNYSFEADYSLFEWFEPYPYGYSFNNWKVDLNILSWWFTVWPNQNLDYSWQIIDWNKWDIFHKAFDTSNLEDNQYKLFRAFESLWLNRIDSSPFDNWSCYWLSKSALMSYNKSSYLYNNHNNLYNVWIDGSTFSNIQEPKINENDGLWNNYTPELEEILALQLSIKSINDNTLNDDGVDTPIKILNEIKNNPEKLYILMFEWEDAEWNRPWHAVVPYRVDWNKIYVWDNNVSFNNPKGILKWYEQYIEVIWDKWNVSSYPHVNSEDFTIMTLVDLEDINNWWEKSRVLWFNENDFLLTLSWKSNILLKDSNWNKSWFWSWETFNEIPWVNILNDYNYTSNWNYNNNWKQLYIPNSIDWIIIEVNWTESENYTLMVAWGNHYTKFDWISTGSWEVDKYEISREKIEFYFDDNKEWTYNLISHDFESNGTWTIFLWNTTTEEWLTKLDINWEEVVKNWESSIIKSIDSDLDWEFEKVEEIQPITNNDWKKWEISGIVFKDKNINWELDDSDKLLKWYKVALYEESWDDFLYNKKWKKKKNPKHKYKCYSWLKNPYKHSNKKENYEHEDINCFVKTNKQGYYSFKDLEDWNYMIELLNNKKKKNKDWFWEVYEITILNGSISTDNNFWISKKWKK